MSINIYCYSCCFSLPVRNDGWCIASGFSDMAHSHTNTMVALSGKHYMERLFDYWFVILNIVIWFTKVCSSESLELGRRWEIQWLGWRRRVDTNRGDFLPSSVSPFTLRLQSIRFICCLLYILSLRNWRDGGKCFAGAGAALLSWNVSRRGCRIFM